MEKENRISRLPIYITGRLLFPDGCSRSFQAGLIESGCFQYGNMTAVMIDVYDNDGKLVNQHLVDTRYDDIVISICGFRNWLSSFFTSHYVTHELVFDAI